MDKYLLVSAISTFVRCSVSLLLKSCISRLTVNVTREAVLRVVCLEEYDKIVAVHKRSIRPPNTG